MEEKRFTWRSYLALISNVLLSLSMIGLDYISIKISDKIGVYLVFIFLIVSTVFMLISFCTKGERKILTVVSFLLWIVNVSIIIFFLWFGANFA